MDPGPHSPLCDDTSTSREDALIVAARRQAEATTPLTPGSGSTSPKSDGNGAARFLADAMPGYEPIGEMHRGGQGVVYEAIQKSTRRRVAIKIMRDGAFASPADQTRFDREILALAQLKHPNIVTIYESGASEGRRYFVMDFIHGLPLDAYVAQMRPSLTEMLQLFVKIAAAVSAAHERGIVHRDLKPSNIRISADGEPHILDFGLAKLAENTLESLFEGDSDVRGLAHTVTGQFVGSPPWASPEQARAHHDEVDIRSDVYSLGIILYHLLVNAFPYDVSEGGMHAVLDRIIHADPVPLRRRRPKLDADLDTIVMKCLEKEPARRYASAGKLGDDLSRLLAGQPIDARRDSAAYLLRKRTLGAIRRHPVVSSASVILVAVAVARVIGVPLVFSWSGAADWFEHRAIAAVPAHPGGLTLEHVRVVGVPSPEETDFLAEKHQLRGVSGKNKKSRRRMHGLLMERLKVSGAKAIVWDLGLYGPSEFDADFVRGVEALAEARIPVIATMKTWDGPVDKQFVVSEKIAEKVVIGCSRAPFDSDVPWRIRLVRQRGLTEPAPSVSLAAFAAVRHPGVEARFVLDVIKETVSVVYRQPGTGSRPGAWLPESDVPETELSRYDVISLSSVDVIKFNDPDHNLLAGDVVGDYLLPMPSNAVLNASTMDYGKVLSATDDELQTWFRDQVVAIGELFDKDSFTHPDGRTIAGVYGHSAGLDALLRRASIRRPGATARLELMVLGAVVGLGIALVSSTRPWLRAILLVLIAGASTLVAIWACGKLDYLCNPFVTIIAMIVGCELGAMTLRFRRATGR